MQPAGFLAVAALAAMGYIYVGKPIAHGVKRIAHGVKHAVCVVRNGPLDRGNCRK